MSTLAIAQAAGRRLLRDKTALFFTLILPIVLILVIGAVARGFNTFKVGIVDLDRSQASHQLVTDLRHTAGISTVSYRNITALNKAVARSEINTGVVLPRGLQADERSGRPVSVGVVAEQANTTQLAAVSRIRFTIRWASSLDGNSSTRMRVFRADTGPSPSSSRRQPGNRFRWVFPARR